MMTRDGITSTANGETQEISTDHFNWSVFRTDLFQCWYGTAYTTAARFTDNVAVQSPVPLVKLVYCLQGRLTLTIGRPSTLTIAPFSHNILHVPADMPILAEWDPIEGQQLLIIDLHIDLFKRNFPVHLPSFHAFRNLLENNEVAFLSEPCLPIGPEMTVLIHDIIQSNRPDFSKPYYVKAKIIELLQLQAEQQWFSMSAATPPLREDEVQRAYHVRDILQQEPGADHTLLSLAHRVGTNDATLKKQFKQVFGTTVFQYLTAHRMQLAKAMLLAESDKVATIAQRVGYKHATHFSAAFKKHFGLLPNQVRI